ncbi:hypothetical protein AAFF_G00173180 [Aldrovandia affinis]|uniref:Uncharacterized protein n=1 Tax=Aldrovandia affinis TaxID=143900 RepID=A0AAD7WW04_9TELE|nr:hypothetical protein AAFF_G00173180 [Aldrovandia affinis]
MIPRAAKMRRGGVQERTGLDLLEQICPVGVFRTQSVGFGGADQWEGIDPMGKLGRSTTHRIPLFCWRPEIIQLIQCLLPKDCERVPMMPHYCPLWRRRGRVLEVSDQWMPDANPRPLSPPLPRTCLPMCPMAFYSYVMVDHGLM